MNRSTHYILNTILAFVLAGMISVTLLLGVWISDRVVPVEVFETKLVTPVVKPGDFVVIQQRLAYERDCAGHVDRYLYDTASFQHRRQLDDVGYTTPPAGLGEKTLTTRERVPDDFVDGKAYYIATPEYYCNWLHRVFWPIQRRPTIVEFQVKR